MASWICILISEYEKDGVPKNFVDHVFGGEMTSTIMCQQCKTVCTVEKCWSKSVCQYHADIRKNSLYFEHTGVYSHWDVFGSFPSCFWWGKPLWVFSCGRLCFFLDFICVTRVLLWPYLTGIQKEKSEKSTEHKWVNPGQQKQPCFNQWKWWCCHHAWQQVPAEEGKEAGKETSEGKCVCPTFFFNNLGLMLNYWAE